MVEYQARQVALVREVEQARQQANALAEATGAGRRPGDKGGFDGVRDDGSGSNSSTTTKLRARVRELEHAFRELARERDVLAAKLQAQAQTIHLLTAEQDRHAPPRPPVN